jgi:hypothetical protein
VSAAAGTYAWRSCAAAGKQNVTTSAIAANSRPAPKKVIKIPPRLKPIWRQQIRERCHSHECYMVYGIKGKTPPRD